MENIRILHDGSVINIPINQVIDKLYYDLAILDPSYTKKEKEQIKKQLSKLEDYMPLYDVFSRNIYIINAENVYSRVIDHHYRFLNKDIMSKIKRSIKSITTDHFKEKLEKNLKFMENFDIDTLQKTYYKLFHLSQPKIQEITSCLKQSFVPFLTMKPYYTRSELINLALNIGLPLSESIEDVCQEVSQNDICSKTILNHLHYIKGSAKSYIQLYTLLGSYYWNHYIRNLSGSNVRDIFTETQIERLYDIVTGAPEFDKDYYVYRFIDNDSYLQHLKPGNEFIDHSFISTTRNPFYDTNNNIFGFILLKIKLPKKTKGIGLCIESFSLFPDEEEILLSPGKLKLVSVDTEHEYYHPSKRASRKITKMYVFEYIESIPLKDTGIYSDEKENIPIINWLNVNVPGIDFPNKVYTFHTTMIPSINNKRYFYSNIGSKKYLFHVFYLDNNPIYEKYFFLQKKTNVHKDEIYFVAHDEYTGEILLIIELRDIISVNYIHRFIGTPIQPFSDKEMLTFIASIAYAFEINQAIIHDNYISYSNISKKLLNGTDISIFSSENPDNHIISLFSGDFKYYNSNIIDHIDNNVKRFNEINGITQNLKNHHFKRFKSIKAMEMFDNRIKTPLYNILVKLRKTNSDINILDFYKYVHENFFYMIKELDSLIIEYDNDVFNDSSKNPWTNSYSILNTSEYLYDNQLITSIRTFDLCMYTDYLKKLSEDHKHISFNNYRLGLL